MSDGMKNQIFGNAFTGVFLLMAGVALFFIEQSVLIPLIIFLIGVFFLTRALAQYRASTE